MCLTGACSTNDPGPTAFGKTSEPVVAAERTKILPSDPGANDAFGAAVAFDGTTIVVGATSYETTGGVFVFRLVGTDVVEEAVLVPTAPWQARDFGYAVDIEGDRVVVGAPDVDGDSGGLAFTFVRSGGTWSQETSIVPQMQDGANFGWSVALDGDWLAVGAPHIKANDDGSANVYLREGSDWTLEDTLTGQGLTFGSDAFGQAVALQDTTLVVGAPGSNLTGWMAGLGAYVFARSGSSSWSQEQVLESTQWTWGRRYGASLALRGTTLLVGCPTETSANVDPYVDFFEYENGQFARTDSFEMQSSNTRSFGQAVALGADVAWLSAPWADPSGSNSGQVGVYLRASGNWTFLEDFVPSDAGADYYAGHSVAAFGRLAVVGVPGDDENGPSSGAAWLVALAGELGEPCTVNDGCESGYCVDGVCCDSACGGQTDDCQACSTAAGATQDGHCGPISGNACEDDDPCTQGGTCDAGTCEGGEPVQCEAQDVCHEPGVCDSATGCSNPVADDGTPCPGGTCQGGVCTLPDGGTAGTGGSGGAGGSSGAGGVGGTGGGAGTGGDGGTAGASGTGGAAGSGGTSTGGTAGAAGRGTGPDGGPGDSAEDVETSGFYACTYGRSPGSGLGWLGTLGLLALALKRRG